MRSGSIESLATNVASVTPLGPEYLAERRQSDHALHVLQVGGFRDPDPLPQLDERLELLCGLRGEKVTEAGDVVANAVDVAAFGIALVVVGIQQYGMKGAVTGVNGWMPRGIDTDEIPLSNSRRGHAFPVNVAKGGRHQLKTAVNASAPGLNVVKNSVETRLRIGAFGLPPLSSTQRRSGCPVTCRGIRGGPLCEDRQRPAEAGHARRKGWALSLSPFRKPYFRPKTPSLTSRTASSAHGRPLPAS